MGGGCSAIDKQLDQSISCGCEITSFGTKIPRKPALACGWGVKHRRPLNSIGSSWYPPPEIIANIAICLLHQANFLIDQQLKTLDKEFVEQGGLRERMTRVRLANRNNPGRK